MGNANINETYGLRICKILENSPASATDLQIYSDFIIDILEKPNKFNLENDFYKFIIENENKTIHFKVYSLLTKESRVVPFTPSRDWPNADFFLGFKVRHESLTAAGENIYRVTGIKNLALTGKVSVHDEFFLAIAEFIYKDLEDLKEKLQLHRRVEIVLFNLRKNRVRSVEIDIVQAQGLGFEIASGYLHDLSFILKHSQKSLDGDSRGNNGFRDQEKSGLFGEMCSEIEMVNTKKNQSVSLSTLNDNSMNDTSTKIENLGELKEKTEMIANVLEDLHIEKVDL